MGVWFPRRAERRRTPHRRRRPRVRRDSKRCGVFAQRRHGLRALVLPGCFRGSGGRQHRPRVDTYGISLPRVHRRPRGACLRPRCRTGAQVWKTTVDDHAFARVTASPVFHDGRLYVGVASGEETAGAMADYQCCRFRGSLLALNAATGQQVWKTYTIAEEALPRSKNSAGTQLWGPSGAPIWSSPAIDVRRNAIYVTTGNNYTGPPTPTSDAFVAFDLKSGKLLWSRQMTAADDWNGSCRLGGKVNCTNADAPDFDFASPPILVTLANGRRALVAGQKSGMVHAIDPDREGQIIWQERVGKGGINGGVQWGSAADKSNVYVALSDIGRIDIPGSAATEPDPNVGGGIFAFRLETGKQVWHTPPPPCGTRKRCSPAQSAPVSVDSRRRVFRIGRRTPARLFRHRRRDPLGCRYDPDLRHHQWRAGTRRLPERRRSGDQWRDVVRRFGLRSERDAGQCPARVLGRRQVTKRRVRQLQAISSVRSVRLQADRHGPAKAGHYVRARALTLRVG